QYILKNTALEAERWVDVRSRTTGQVVSILKEEGDPIQVGNVLARLDSDASRINVLQREVAFRESQQRYERESALFERNLGSKEGYENAETQLEAARAQLEQAKLSLSYTSITSPIDGVMTLRNIEVGNMVTNNQVVGAVAKFDPLLARIQVTEKDFGKIVVGQAARITVEAFPGRGFMGTVKMVSPVVDPESGTVKVTVEVPRPKDGLLRPGMFASVYIITETRSKTLVVPKKALVLEGAGNQVFVFEPDPETGMGKAQRKTVEIGFTDSDRLEVLAGVSEGDQVITVGQEGLRPGATVRVVGDRAPAVVERKGDGKKSNAERGGGQGGGDDRTKRILAMIQRVPEAKKAYDARLKTDPTLAKDFEKLRAFVSDLREKGIIQSRGRRGN
ncbi:MAG: efflux RND transporter periplasmic adaptor subunit, partial [Candidatus Latescibacteria bacterium]|nr:efflux RND transporter periplasmic adaptor subunit [Candidatus Latescibacterota bacterium]